MINFLDDENVVLCVVVNHEGQYSLWPEGRDIPPGWKSIGVKGDKATCLAHIEKVWTDMRPLSLQNSMAKTGR